MFDVFAQLLFRLTGRATVTTMAIQRNVMAGYVVSAILLRDKIVEQAFVAGMRTRGVAMVGAGQRVLETEAGPQGVLYQFP